MLLLDSGSLYPSLNLMDQCCLLSVAERLVHRCRDWAERRDANVSMTLFVSGGEGFAQFLVHVGQRLLSKGLRSREIAGKVWIVLCGIGLCYGL